MILLVTKTLGDQENIENQMPNICNEEEKGSNKKILIFTVKLIVLSPYGKIMEMV